MKKIFFVGLLFVNIIQILGQGDFESKDRERISKNKVRRQTQWEYDYINGNPSTNGYRCAASTYDKKGNVIEVLNYNSKDSVTSVLAYAYDANNNKTSYSRYKGLRSQLTYNKTIKFDEKGNKVVESGFDGASVFNNIFSYNENNKVSEIKYSTDKSLTEKRTFKYSGSTTEMSILSPSSVVLSREISILDNKNNVLEETKYIQNNVAQKSNYAYDPTGKKVEEIKENLGTLAYRRKFTYAPNGNLVQISEEKPGVSPFITYQYKYDPKGNVVEEKWAKEPGKEYSIKTHKYDAKGLLIETEFYNATYKLNVTYRFTYEYY
jgi:hypothetical protein